MAYNRKFKEKVVQTYKKLGCRPMATCEAAGVPYNTFRRWRQRYKWFDEACTEAELRTFEDVQERARILALGIPERDDQGRLIGWTERPSERMIELHYKYLARQAGMDPETVHVDHTSGGEKITGPQEVKISIDGTPKSIQKQQNEEEE